ncbi:hypothetical protein PHISP_07955 [Aspergillus sp. HF37]|nr:hypothetical protein PHISP_07955 [Aspergillus sp. HF37]
MPHVKGVVVALATLSMVSPVIPQNVRGNGVIKSDTYFYGQSPPFYPTPEISGIGDWDEALSRAQALVSQMSLEEKVHLTGGQKNDTMSCGGYIPAINRLGFPGMCLQDGPAGVRAAEGVNGYPSSIHVGASWNKSLAYDRSYAMAGEFKKKGATVSLGPAIGPLGRITLGGRNWENYGVDPYISGIMVAETVKGIQDGGVISCTKHFIGNEQETNRNPQTDPRNKHTIESLSSNVDDKTMHEMYLWPFADAVHAGTASIMCSYQRMNNSYGCQNSKTMNGLLKTELGFQGFVLTDWTAHRSGAASALAGLDMAMPYGSEYWGSQLVEAVRNGTVPESRVEDMVTRILAAWYYSNQDDPSVPQVGAGLPSDFLSPHEVVDARVPEASTTLVEGAIQGHVLVKNVDKALPLTKPRMLAVYGYDAETPEKNNPLNGLNDWTIGFSSHDYRTVTCGFGPNGGECPYFPPIANGTLMGGGGSGAITPFYIDGPMQALAARARQDGTQLFWALQNSTATVPGATDACLVFINAFSSEGVDRSVLRDDYSDALVQNIASQCPNTIVVVHNAGNRLVEPWIDHPNVTAVVLAHLPGQDSGEAITQILHGDVSPSGKLPYTIAQNESDYGAVLHPTTPNPHGWDRYYPQDNFTEGVYIDYRAFDESDIEPRFEFGFGLTYTSFEYSNLKIQNTVDPSTLSALPVGHIIPGGHADLWDTIATVAADVTNTGDVVAAEVGQLYVTIPDRHQPMRQLRGFDKVAVRPGETKTLEFELRRRDLSVWDVVAQQWRLLTGSEYHLSVGASSRKLLLNGALSL